MNYEEYLTANSAALLNMERTQIEVFSNFLHELSQHGGRLWVAGNGGAASTASHAVADFNKTISGNNRKTIRTISLTEMTSLTTAFANDVDYQSSISGPLGLLADKNDALLVISVSGTSPNIVSALKFANEHQIKTLCIFGEQGRSISDQVDFPIIVNSSDYQIVENVQLYLIHWIVKFMMRN
jgi:D-sedoheptulose 7-phosphate isomerase